MKNYPQGRGKKVPRFTMNLEEGLEKSTPVLRANPCDGCIRFERGEKGAPVLEAGNTLSLRPPRRAAHPKGFSPPEENLSRFRSLQSLSPLVRGWGREGLKGTEAEGVSVAFNPGPRASV